MSKVHEYELIVIGGGAAGFFAAIQVAGAKPATSVLILEKTNKLLSKVKVSGGGRCNVTHACFNPFELAHHYPRGEKALKNLFKRFQASDMVEWLRKQEVILHTEEDGRMFPVTDSSQTIIDCFINEAIKRKIVIKAGTPVVSIGHENSGLVVRCESGDEFTCKKILIAIGGSAKISSYGFIRELGHKIKAPLPSLFTFNEREKKFIDLMGVSVISAGVRIQGTKFFQQGPLLITHWGLSGPAVIRLSAWAAEYLYEKNYNFNVLVNWTGSLSEEEVRNLLLSMRKERAKQKVAGKSLFSLPSRLWEKLCGLAEISADKVWGELSNHHLNKLLENLIRCSFNIQGKTTFKEEFVTCGGVPLEEINLETMESKVFRNVYFAGEVLDIDGETGGFNFQAAWTTAFVAAQAIIKG